MTGFVSRAENVRAASEWLRRWYRIGKARSGKRGLVLIERVPGGETAASLMRELGETQWLRDDVRALLRAPEMEITA